MKIRAAAVHLVVEKTTRLSLMSHDMIGTRALTSLVEVFFCFCFWFVFTNVSAPDGCRLPARPAALSASHVVGPTVDPRRAALLVQLFELRDLCRCWVNIISPFFLIKKRVGFVRFFFSLMVLVIPVNVFISRMSGSIQGRLLEKADERVDTVSEFLRVVQAIKLLSLEAVFAKRLDAKRNEELRFLQRFVYFQSLSFLVWQGTPLLVTGITYGFYSQVCLAIDNNRSHSVSCSSWRAVMTSLMPAPSLCRSLCSICSRCLCICSRS